MKDLKIGQKVKLHSPHNHTIYQVVNISGDNVTLVELSSMVTKPASSIITDWVPAGVL